jgi:general secretion pathway protein K
MKKGFALALTLWIVAMLSLVSALYLSYGKKVVMKTRELNKKLELTFEAESTIELLKFYIATGNIYRDRVSNSNFQKLFPSFPKFFFIDGRPKIIDNSTISLQDTAGLINIHDNEAFSNYLSKDLNLEERNIINDSMRDWLDLDEFSLLNGGESAFYRQKGYLYGSRNEGYISSIEELFLIRGVEKYKNIERDKLTLSTVVIRNILTMTPRILGKVYRFTPNEIEQLVEAKKEGRDFFTNLFYRFNVYNRRPELDGFITSNILKMNITINKDNIYKKIELLITFRPNNIRAFEVLEYTD